MLRLDKNKLATTKEIPAPKGYYKKAPDACEKNQLWKSFFHLCPDTIIVRSDGEGENNQIIGVINRPELPKFQFSFFSSKAEVILSSIYIDDDLHWQYLPSTIDNGDGVMKWTHSPNNRLRNEP